MEDEKLSHEPNTNYTKFINEYDYGNITTPTITTNTPPQTYTYSTTTNTSIHNNTSSYNYGFFDLDPATITESIETEEDAKDLLEKLNEVEARIKAKLDELKGKKVKRRKLNI